MIGYIPKKYMKKIPEINGEICLSCLNEPNGECKIHMPTPLSFEESFAMAVEHCVQIGLLKRESKNTALFNF